MSNIKVFKSKGKEEGKNVIIMAGVHGNERFGVEALKEILPELKILRGELTVIFANLKAIKQNKRFIEFNLNRCFLKKQSGRIKNTLEGKTAKEIIPCLDKANCLLDIHGSNTKKSLPFIICQPHSFKIAKKLPFDIIAYNWDKFQKGSSDYYMNLKNKIGIAIECGYIKSPESKVKAKEAIRSFLKAIYSNQQNKKTKKYYKIIGLYKNKYGKFVKARDFADFELLEKKALIGLDGNKKVYGEKGDFLLFVRNKENLKEECFLIAKEETLLNTKRLITRERI